MPRYSVLRNAVLAGLICATVAGPASAQSFGFATFHAIVSGAGVVYRASGIKSVTHQSAGRYVVKFTRSVITCTFTATPWGANGGQVSVQRVSGQPVDAITVFTFSRTGVRSNLTFNLMVGCS